VLRRPVEPATISRRSPDHRLWVIWHNKRADSLGEVMNKRREFLVALGAGTRNPW